MSLIHLQRKITIFVFLTYFSLSTSQIFASGFQLNETSPGLQGAANAGAAATANDVSSMFTNPATLTTLLENQVYVGASAIFPDISMSGAEAIHTVNIPGSPPTSISARVQGTTSQGNVSQAALIPDGYFGYRINDSLVAGIGIVSPFGLTTTYDNTSVLRFTAQKSSLITVNINPALGIKLNDRWSIGVGLQFQYGRAIFSNFNGPYTGIPAIDALIAANYPTKLKANGWGYGATAGVLFIPCKGTRLGAGYRSKIVQDLSGHGQEFVSPGPTVPAPSQNFLFNAETSVYGNLNVPAVLTLSIAQDIQNWTLKASAQLNFWSSFEHLSINTPDAFGINSTIAARWKNAWLLAAGADYRFSPCWIVRGGVAYDQTPTRNQYRDPRIADSDRYWLTAGFTYKINNSFAIDGAYEHIFAKNQKVDVIQAAGSSATSTLPLEVNQVRANYKGRVDILALAIRYSFC